MDPHMFDEPKPAQATRWDKIAVAAAVGAALAAAAAAGVAAWQGSIANEALIEARVANDIARRPYIRVDLMPETFTIGPTPGRGGSPMSMQFRATNVGKFPANVSIRATASWIAQRHPLDTAALNSVNIVASRFLFADQDSGDLTVYTNGLSDGELVDLKANEARSFSVRIETLYGPDEKSLGARSNVLCYNYPLKFDGARYRLGVGQPVNGKGCNTAS